MVSSVYIHIPFCKNICSYCAFPKVYYFEDWVDQYLERLKEEIVLKYQNEEISTIYIGGGTPNCLSFKQLKKLFDITEIFQKKSDCEFTVECNIEDLTQPKIQLMKKYQVNRISLGVQTMQLKYLSLCNRKHTPDMVKDKIKLLKEEKFDNINIDLIYGFPSQSLEELQQDLSEYIQLQPTHISTYSLMIDPHTSLYNQKREEINQDLDAEMYELICKFLKENGFCHYEISNFSKEHYCSQHNLTYWNNEFYYGFGMGASSYIKNVRKINTHNLIQYLRKNYQEEIEYIDLPLQLTYEFILGFRKLRGISKSDFMKKYHKDMKEIPVVQKLLEKGDLKEDLENIFIPEDKLYISNEILLHFL